MVKGLLPTIDIERVMKGDDGGGAQWVQYGITVPFNNNYDVSNFQKFTCHCVLWFLVIPKIPYNHIKVISDISEQPYFCRVF